MDYIVIRKDDELMHYGVKGMRWGVRKATKQLSRATTSEQRDKAVASLEKHRAKASHRVVKLEKKQTKLDNALAKSSKKDAVKAAKIENKAAKIDKKIAKMERKATGIFTSDKKTEELLLDAGLLRLQSDKLHTKASVLQTNYETAKAKAESNRAIMNAFKKGISDIDAALIENGRRYING